MKFQSYKQLSFFILCGAFFTTCLMATPAVVIALKAFAAPGSLWGRLWETRIPELLGSSLILAFGTVVLTLLWGVSGAWVITRYNFYGRKLWRWLLASPLAIPPYILAFVYVDLWSGTGWVYNNWLSAVWVLSLATYPYVFLLARTSLANFHQSYEDAARVTGCSPWKIFSRITLPLMRPALASGALLVSLYCLSDFGAVSVLRYTTFTRVVYLEMNHRGDLAGAAVLSFILLLLCLVVILGEHLWQRRATFYQSVSAAKPIARKPLGVGKTIGVWLGFSTLFFSSTGLVLLRLFWKSGTLWKTQGWASLPLKMGFNSFQISWMGASLALLGAVCVVWVSFRYKSKVIFWVMKLNYAGYVLPGPMVAIAIIIFFLNYSPISMAYGTLIFLAGAYAVRFLPLALHPLENIFLQLTPSLQDATRLSRASIWQKTKMIFWPLIKPGFLTAWTLLFLNMMRELPVTLLLRPVGFETLSSRIWMETNNEFFSLASPSALLMVLISLPLIGLVLSQQFSWQKEKTN